MFLAGEAPLPGEYRFLPSASWSGRCRRTSGSGSLLAVDCANESRIGADPPILDAAPITINIDHHHDNSRFGDVNLVVADASSTGEVLRDVFGELGVELTPELAEPLYVALVTDTGRFQYSNTTPKALRLAAELVEAGADVHKVFQGVYESIQFAKLKLLARALERAEVYAGGAARRLVPAPRRLRGGRRGRAVLGGDHRHLRAVEGAEMAALIREPPRGGSPARRVSLRASHDELDVSAIARQVRRRRPSARRRGSRATTRSRRSRRSSSVRSPKPRAGDAAEGPGAERDHPRGQAGRALVVRDREPRPRSHRHADGPCGNS